MPKMLTHPTWYDKGGTEINIFDSIVSSQSSIAIGINSNAHGSNGIAIGQNAKSSNTSTSVGDSSYSVTDGVAIGHLSNAYWDGAIAIGNNAKTTSTNASYHPIAIGYDANSTGHGSIAIGGSVNTATHYAVAIGSNARVVGSESVAVGRGAVAYRNYSIAIGYNANTGSATVETPLVQLGDNSRTFVLRLGNGVNTSNEGSSDPRVKEDIELADTARCLTDVMRLPVNRYKYKDFVGNDRDVHRTGWLATDVEAVFPKNVIEYDENYPVLDENGERQYDEDGNLVTFTMENVKHICMQEALPTLWAAVQELAKRNAQLEERIMELEGR